MKKTIQLIAIIIVMIFGSVKVNAQCYINAGPDQTFCCGPVAYSLNAVTSLTNCGNCTNYSFVWSPTTGLSNPFIPNPIATVTSNITYVVCVTAYKKNNCTGICCTVCDTIKLFVNSSCCRTTGMSENNKNIANIQTYPNPSTSNLTVDVITPLNNANMSLYDITGRVIWQKNNITGKSKFDINVADMPRGIYFITAKEDGKEIYNNKVILE